MVGILFLYLVFAVLAAGSAAALVMLARME
jgi:hypothetical protein